MTKTRILKKKTINFKTSPHIRYRLAAKTQTYEGNFILVYGPSRHPSFSKYAVKRRAGPQAPNAGQYAPPISENWNYKGCQRTLARAQRTKTSKHGFVGGDEVKKGREMIEWTA